MISYWQMCKFSFIYLLIYLLTSNSAIDIYLGIYLWTGVLQSCSIIEHRHILNVCIFIIWLKSIEVALVYL